MTKRQSRTTIVDIAKCLGVNHSTISRALANSPLISSEMKIKVKQLAKEMGYAKNPFADGLRTGKTKIVELVYYSEAEYLHDDPILLLVLDTFQHELSLQNYKTMLNIIRQAREPVLTNLEFEAGVADGIIVASSRKIAPQYKSQLDPLRFVLLDNNSPGYSAVRFDHYDSLQVLIEYLISKGSKRIVGLTTPYSGRYSLSGRVSSYKKIFRKYPLTNLGIITVKNDKENPIPQIRKLKPFPDTVICMTNLEKTIDFATAEGLRIPEDLNIVGILDIENSNNVLLNIPHITLNWKELVKQSVLCLLAQLKGEKKHPVQVLIKSPIIYTSP